MTRVKYLREQLGFTAKEWNELTDSDKEDLKRWAEEEMKLCGVEVDGVESRRK